VVLTASPEVNMMKLLTTPAPGSGGSDEETELDSPPEEGESKGVLQKHLSCISALWTGDIGVCAVCANCRVLSFCKV
jgi:hypothetical protein